MKYLTLIIITSLSLSSYYDIGDIVTDNHQNEAFDVCYGDYPQDQLKLSHFNGKISIFGLSTTWWPTDCTFSLEGLIESIGNDSRIKIFESLDDIGQPYSCTQWGDLGQENLPVIIQPNAQYQIHSWFSLSGYFGNIVILDPNMVYRYYGSDIDEIYNIIDQILEEEEWIIGDIDFNHIVNVQDIVLLVNFILGSSYGFSADVNNDQIVNIQDIIILINIILNN